MQSGNKTTVPHRALLDLLEHTEIPAEKIREATELRDRLARDLTIPEVKAATRDFAALVCQMRSDALHQKTEMEHFLLSISDRIRMFATHLSEVLGSQSEKQDRNANLRTALEGQLSDIRTSMRDSGHIDHLKEAVEQSLATIETNVLSVLGSQSEDFDSSQQTIQVLSAKLRRMEVDAIEMRMQIAKERERATHDALTGLPNRLALDERMPEEFERWRRYGQPLTLSILDVDHFKKVNDERGHSAGDKVLKEIAQAVRSNVRKSDLVVRYGGEELLVLMPGVNLKQGRRASEKLRDHVENMRFIYSGERVPVTISIGVAEFRIGDQTDAVFNRADAALYLAKESGRNRVCGENEIGGS